MVKLLLCLAHLVCRDWFVQGPRENRLLRRVKCIHLNDLGGGLGLEGFIFIQGGYTDVVIHNCSKRSFVAYFRIIYENILFSLVSAAQINSKL